MMITSIAGYNYTPARTQTFSGGPKNRNEKLSNTVGMNNFQSSPKTENKVWDLGNEAFLLMEINRLKGEIHNIYRCEPKIIKAAELLERYKYILKQVQANGTFTETPDTFKKPEYIGISKVWGKDDFDSLKKGKNVLLIQQVNDENNYGYPKPETLKQLYRLEYILKQVQKHGTFKETPNTFKKIM